MIIKQLQSIKNKGAVAVEYLFTIFFVALIMTGMYKFFEGIAVKVLNRFVGWVQYYP